MIRVNHARTLSLAALAALVACSGGGGTTTGSVGTSGAFTVLQTDPAPNGRLYLNDPIQIDFTHEVDLNTADLNTVSFKVFDQLGNPLSEQVAGNFELGRTPGDSRDGRRLRFVPRFPTNDTFDNGGFRPGRKYLVQLVGGQRLNGTALLDKAGRTLLTPYTVQFNTAEGISPSALFRNSAPGGPRRTALEVSPAADATTVVLNKLGQSQVEVRLQFDQPLNPSSANLPAGLDLDPLVRNKNTRGPVFLEYDDPVFGIGTWIPADIELESNRPDGATLVLRPVGVLPNNATVRVIVESSLEDISGESNVADAAYDRVFGTFQTQRAYEEQFDAIVEDFQNSDRIDLTAPYNEPIAEVGPGYIKAGFAFEGTPTNLEFEPSVQNVVLNTNFTQVTPKDGVPYNVSGGVFNFKNVKIPVGVTVRGQGSNPMIWLVSGSFEVAGTLSVRGGDGVRASGFGSANIPKAGGYGACGGGDGGAGSPSATHRDDPGAATGNGPLQQPLKGGVGGTLDCFIGCGRGSGGGGGALATQGDPHYRTKTVPAGATPQPVFQQQLGIGGQGCTGTGGAASRSLSGGPSGATVFTDSRQDNNYWGSAIMLRDSTSGTGLPPLRITGELSVPVGGGGGGGGGDWSYNGTCGTTDVNFASDASGGGGGGGGGVLVVKALGDIIIRDSGHIVADGGSGGGGEISVNSLQGWRGGGGGAGAGGMVVLMSATRIEIGYHGTRYADKDYNFAISADGGACTTGTAVAPFILSKYPSNGTECWAANYYDSMPLGGLGGMGIVQLMVPPGSGTAGASSVDQTNTRLDDNIHLIGSNGLEVVGTAKQNLLAWRGFLNASGQLVDDLGVQTAIGNTDNEGDIRPSPVLMPVPFGAKTRIRSKWIDTGASERRRVLFDNGEARSIIDTTGTPGSVYGPIFDFAGLFSGVLGSDLKIGYASYSNTLGSNIKVDYPIAVASTAILTVDSNAKLRGASVYQVQLASAALGSVDDRYSQYEAEVLDEFHTVVGSFRILSHTENMLWLSPESGAFPSSAIQLQVVKKFFKIMTNGLEGLGATYPGAGSQRVPNSNVRIGFAFHQDPANSAATRYPATPGTYVYNLDDSAVQNTIRQLGASYVQYDILFDCNFKSISADDPPAFGPSSPRPELHFLRLPFRF